MLAEALLLLCLLGCCTGTWVTESFLHSSSDGGDGGAWTGTGAGEEPLDRGAVGLHTSFTPSTAAAEGGGETQEGREMSGGDGGDLGSAGPGDGLGMSW